MRLSRWIYLPFTLLLLAACSSNSGGPSAPCLFCPTPTLASPVVGVTHAPDAQAAVTAFLEALKSNDLTAMYGMLSSASQAAVPQDAFLTKYNDALNTMGAATLDYQVISLRGMNPTAAQVGFKITYHTALVGDIEREMLANLVLEQGAWRLNWDDSLILPELAGGNVLKMEYQIPARGDIYARNGDPIVTQTEAYALGIKPGELGNNSGALIGALARVCHRTTESIEDALQGQAPDWYVAMCTAAASEIKDVLNLGAGGLVWMQYNSRFYMDQGIAPQAVGYASLIPKEELDQYRRRGYRGDEKVGQSGIEKSMEQYLAGKHGGTLSVVDPSGQIVSRLASSPPEAADSVYLTIDRNLQHYAQLAFGNFHGAAVVLEMNTGRVLAMVSSPEYDPNLFDAENYNSSIQLGDMVNSPDQPLVNRAAQGAYPLGSAFKPITMAAGLESGLYLPITTYDCQYDFTELEQYGGPVLHDWTYEHCQNRLRAGLFCDTSDSRPSGLLTLQEGLMRSCNPYFWHIGLDLFNNDRAGDIAEMARGFGLGSATGIDAIAEATGNISVPTTPVDATNQAIGQGDLTVTPLQVARFVAAIGNGGTLYRPQIIEKIQPVDGPPIKEFKPEVVGTLPVRPDNLAAIQEAMSMVINNPRGTANFRLRGLTFQSAGKTGTAQSGSGEPHAWFIGYTQVAANTNLPDIAVAVIVENAGEGSDYAAPLFRALVETYYYGSWQARPWFASDFGQATYTPTQFGANATPRP
ncbi:MAG TPA: penicillin-binding transpeptidase domain-containing protein [Anaerolineales bacterium]